MRVSAVSMILGGMDAPAARLTALNQRFFDDWIAAEPEEATTLGLPDADGRLRDPSPAAADAFARIARSALADLDAIEREGPLDREGRLDAWALRAHATERVLAAERARPESGIESVPYGIMMLAHAAAHAATPADRATVSKRLEALPAYIESTREALATGVRNGRPFATAVIGAIVDQLGTAPNDLQAIVDTAFAPADGEGDALVVARDRAALAGRAAASLGEFLRDIVASSPGARDVVPMGEAEYQRRLTDWWSLGSISSVRKRAADELAVVRDRIIEVAAAVAVGMDGAPASVRTFAHAKQVLDVTMEARPATAADVIPAYEREIARAIAFCRQNGVFAIPDTCDCAVLPSPELWRRFSVCTNWPAPLLAGDAPGTCAVLIDPSVHPLVNVPGLAVHEAVPGHFLQSRAWQLRFHESPAPIRFLSVPDECGVLRDAWIPHFMVEGWAVFAEARMEEAGFYEPRVRLFHLFCRAIHAARALADMGLHTEEWSRERVSEFLSEATGFPPWLGSAQGVRYARSGLQANGYLIGALAIEDLRAQTKERLGSAYDELAFQSDLLDAGPVPPALLAAPAGDEITSCIPR